MSEKKLKKQKRGLYKVILHDDNHNTFEHVIDTIIDVCGYNYLQAVQCTILVNEMKRCAIFEDHYNDCEIVLKLMKRQGLKVTIEKC